MLRPTLFTHTKPMFFDENFFDFWDNGLSHMENFHTDILDQGDHYLLQAELPGFQKEDITLDLADDTLTICASHQEEDDINDKKHNYIRKERHYNSYKRSFQVDGISPNDISAEYKNGILEIQFPKRELEEKEEVKRIEIK